MAPGEDAMPKVAKPLTVRTVEGAQPRPDGHYDLSDGGRGLLLRVHPSGRRTWHVRAVDRRTGERVRRELGAYPDLGLAEARTQAAAWKAQIERGDDPARPAGEMTVARALDAWLQDAGLRSGKLVRRRMELHVLPTLGRRLLGEVEQRDVARLLRGLRHEKGLTAEVNRVRASLGALFSWAQRQGEVESNPVAGTAKAPEPSAERERAGKVRVLSLGELVRIWRAAEADGSPVVSALVCLLILVPVRREEWTRARWDEIERATDDGGAERWTLRIPATRMKGKRPHAVPLPAAGVAIIQRLRAVSGPGDGPFIFTLTGGRTHFAGWRKAAPRIAQAAALTAPWTIHDLRRGAASAMGEAGIREAVIRRILAHSGRGMMGVTATYERSERLGELRDALERWAGIVVTHLGSEGAETARVVPFPSPRAAAE
jgi:integrase